MFRSLKHWSCSTLGTLFYLCVLVLLLEQQSPRFFCWDDNATQFCGYYQYNYDSLVNQKTFPWMVWTQYGGQTNLTQSQSGVFYLPAYLATFLSWKLTSSPFWNIDIIVAFHLVLGCWGIKRFLTHHHLPQEISSLTALLYSTTPFYIFVSKSWVFVSASMAYTPWIFLCLHLLTEKPTFCRILSYALLKTLFFFQGYSHIWINLSFIEGLYFLWVWYRLPSRSFKGVALFSLTQIIHFIMILPQLSINLSSVKDSPYRGGRILIDQLLAFRLDPADAFLAQLFIFLKERYLLASSAILFLGGSLLLLYLIYDRIRSKESISFLSQNSLLFLILTFLLSTSFYGILTIIPPFNILRWPIKFMMIVPFFHAITLAYFINEAHWTKPHWKARALLFVLILQAGIVFCPQHQSPFSRLRFSDWEDFKVLWPYQEGRVLAVASEEKYVSDPKMLAYNYGTWTGIPTLGGYDQLVSKLNSKIGLGLQISSYLDIQDLDRVKPHLEQWSVRYHTISPQDPLYSAVASKPWLKLIHQEERVHVFENTEAQPIASFSESPAERLSLRFTPQSIEVNPNSKTGTLTIRTAPLPQLQILNSKISSISPETLKPVEFILKEPHQSLSLSYQPSPTYKILCGISSTFILLSIIACLHRYLKS